MKSETNKENVAFNRIGIDDTFDWARIQKLLKIGVFASILAMIGDLMLGWGVRDESLPGFFRMFSAYTGTSDKQLFAVALLGLFGMTLEGLSFFGIYRLIAPKSPRYAHHYRSGIIGYLLFGPCGFHVTVCGIIFMYKHLPAAGVAQPEELLSTYMHYFFLPAFILFWIFFFVLEGAHIIAFAKGKTPLPKWSFIFSMPFGLLLAKCVNVFGNHPIVNAIDCAWIHIACLWTFAGLLIVTLTTAKKLGGNS